MRDNFFLLKSQLKETAMVIPQLAIEKLGEIIAYNEFAEPVRLAELWHEHCAVLVFVRHFG